ncbi:MAG TPA: hypothetical protein VGO90_16345 [Chthoniobacteraceae bacterium]|nr:hypothetical protein [Chthoniobacteraceae bacterium]
MNEPSTRAPVDPPILAQPWAVRLGLCVLLGFAAILAMTFRDASRRKTIEHSSENTAVGDQSYFTRPSATVKLPVLAAEIAGRPLYLTATNGIEVRDTHVVRVDRDAQRGLTLYQLAANATDKERERAGRMKNAYLLKVQPSEFLKVQDLSGKEQAP